MTRRLDEASFCECASHLVYVSRRRVAAPTPLPSRVFVEIDLAWKYDMSYAGSDCVRSIQYFVMRETRLFKARKLRPTVAASSSSSIFYVCLGGSQQRQSRILCVCVCVCGCVFFVCVFWHLCLWDATRGRRRCAGRRLPSVSPDGSIFSRIHAVSTGSNALRALVGMYVAETEVGRRESNE